MLRAKVTIERTPEGLWKADDSSIQIDAARQIGLSRMRPEESLAELIETIMGDALLALDKNGRRGTSERIQWEITVDGVPHCYRCVEPMQETVGPSGASKTTDGTNWKCVSCGAMIQYGSSHVD
jgi:hypothetical protein